MAQVRELSKGLIPKHRGKTMTYNATPDVLAGAIIVARPLLLIGVPSNDLGF